MVTPVPIPLLSPRSVINPNTYYVTTIETLQIIGACLALLLQAAATILTKNVRQLFPQKLWWVLFGLNFLELGRRVAILFSVTHTLNQSSYNLITVFLGLLVSIVLFVIMSGLSRPSRTIHREIATIAKETVKKVEAVKVEQPKKQEESIAFGLANHFIQSRERTAQQ